MDNITELLANVHQYHDVIVQYLKFAGILIFGFLFLSSFIRFIFGKKAQLNRAVSSAMEILCLYIINIIVYSVGFRYEIFLAPLPFVSLSGDYISFFPILSADFTVICDQVLKILIIAFLVNIVNDILPKGKHLLSWYFFRLLAVVLAVGINYLVDLLLFSFLPQGFTDIAPTVLMIALVALVLLGSLKLIAGLALSFFDPILGALYTFFFSNFIGRELARAMATTALLTALVVALDMLEITSVYIAAAALTGYIPLLVILLALWYFVGHIL